MEGGVNILQWGELLESREQMEEGWGGVGNGRISIQSEGYCYCLPIIVFDAEGRIKDAGGGEAAITI